MEAEHTDMEISQSEQVEKVESAKGNKGKKKGRPKCSEPEDPIAHYRSLEFVGFAVYICEGGRIVHWSGPAKALYGWRRREAVGRYATRLIGDEDYESSIRRIIKSSNAGSSNSSKVRRTKTTRSSSSSEFYFRKKSGEMFTAMVTKDLMYEHNDIVAVVTIANAITYETEVPLVSQPPPEVPLVSRILPRVYSLFSWLLVPPFHKFLQLVTPISLVFENMVRRLRKEESVEINRTQFVENWLESCYGGPGNAFEEVAFNQERLQISQISERISQISESYVVSDFIDAIGECNICWSDLSLGNEIAQGASWIVYRGLWRRTNVTVKVYTENIYGKLSMLEFKDEIAMMKLLRHPNVPLFMGVVYSPERFAIVSEFLPRNNLYTTLHVKKSGLDIKKRLRMALDVATGMTFLHERIPPVIHRDLKSSSLIVDLDWTIKIEIFGLLEWNNATGNFPLNSVRGTPQYTAPELLRNKPANEKADVFSFGVVLWELLTESIPWLGLSEEQVIETVGFQNRRLEVPQSVDPKLSSLIKSCWESDPDERPCFNVVTKKIKKIVEKLHQAPVLAT